ncbi:hypothetical protein [Natronosalvus halobius]|uniref:hypothetical protein n=1 Tax=Natronosalvus halobius TaxID=2953746 RepID=UPI00209CACB7|nr:hypothetical protein [Natronosalvus halobius]USZ73478.1 hypothetical protein NGM15_12555 [Natronosalvus halobius]
MTNATPDGRQLDESGDGDADGDGDGDGSSDDNGKIVSDRTTPDATHDESDATHLEDVDVGAGCTEIWEHLAERREE